MVLEHRRLGAAHHVAAILLASVLGLFSQNAPILRNSWSTNAAGTPVQGADNLSVTNLGSGTNWQFFNVGPKTVARLSDVSNIVTAVSGSVTNALSIISSNGVVVASGVTNLDLVGGTNIDWKITNSPAGYVHAAPHVNMAAIQTVVNTSSNSLYGVSSNITIAVGTGATNYAAGTANNVSNWVNSVSNRFNTFSVNNSNLSWAIGTAATNYAAGTANNVSNWVNAVSNRFNGFSVNNSNLSWSIGANGTNFAYSIGANATSFVYSIGQNSTNFTLNIATNKIDNTNGFGTNLTVYGPFFIDPNATPAPGQIWTATNSNGSGTWSNAPVAAGASPGGASFMLQFNNAGSFAGMTNTGATNSTGTVGMSNLVLSGNLDVAGTQTVSVLETPMIFLTGVTQGLAYFAAAQTNLTNLPFGTGMLTNKGDGTMGWMAIPAGGAGALQTNANQFGANVVLNIKDGASVTNTTNFGNFTTMTNMDWKGGRVTHVPLNSDIQTYANNALAGDTLILGSGTYTQNTSIVITNQMNIVGQGSAGWVTDPTTESHGTRIATISGNNVTMFDVRTNNVRFSTFSIWMTNGANRVGIAVSSNLQGIVVRNVDIMMDGGTPQCGIVVNSSDTTLRECKIYANSANGTAYGLLLSNGPTSSISSTCDVFGLIFSAQGSGAGNNAYGILCTNRGSANSLVLNLAYTQVRSPAAASVTNIALAAMGPNAIVNSFMSTLDGADYDVVQEGGSTLNLGGSVVVNNLIQGTPTYRAVMVSGAVTTTNLSMLGPALSYSDSASNGPAANEFPTAQWVRGLFNNGLILYSSTNEITAATNVGSGQIMYSFIPSVPNYAAKRHYPAVNAADYIGSVMWTNPFTTLQGPIDVNAYLEMTNGTGGPSVTMHPEIYYSYDKTNWLGDWDAADQSITTGTNLYQWVVSFPTITSTNSTGFYIQRRFRIGAATGATHPGVVFHIGTNYYSGTNNASFISVSGSRLSPGDAFLGGNNVFTGTNVFGFVGIGTNPPFAKLHVGHPINTNAMFQVDSTNGYVFVIKTNGYVGIGTNNPQIPLEIIGQTLAGGPDATIDQPHSLLRLGQYANNVMDFGIGPNGYGWIQGLNRHVAGIYYPITLNPVPGSQVGIGTNYMTGTAILHVVGDNSLDDLLRIGTTNADNVFVITTNSTLFMYSKFTNTSAYARTYISNNAAMTIGNTSIGGATNKPIVFRIGALDAFRIETNGTLVGNLVNSVGSNGIVYAATNINFVGNTKITNVNGLISVDVTPGTGGTPTTTLGDMIVRGAAADERLPVGGFGDRLIVINGVPTWVDTATKLYVNDGFLRPVSSSAIGTLDGCASISGSVAMDQVRPTTMGVGRNGFCRIRHAAASATVNVMGCTTIASGDSWIMTNGVYLSSDLVFETSSTGMVCQVGLLGVQATSNQTAGIFFEKQPEATGEGTWHIRTVGVQNTNIALGLVASQTEWLKLEMIGTTNSMLFKTNGVAAFTNNASATMPSGITLLPGVLTMTNGVAGVAQVLWLDYFKVIEY